MNFKSFISAFVCAIILGFVVFGWFGLYMLLEDANSRSIEKNQLNKEMLADDFVELVQGYWANAKENSCDVLYIEEREICMGVYPGSWSRPGKIEEVVENSDGNYIVTIFYPEHIVYEGGTPMSEERETLFFSISDSFDTVLILANMQEEIFLYDFVGTSYDEYKENCDELLREISRSDTMYINIPEISQNAQYIGQNIDVLQARYSLVGPDISNSDWAENLFGISGTDSLNVYRDFSGSSMEFYGAKNGEIVFYGRTNIQANRQIKDYLLDENLFAEPAKYSFKASVQAYVWKVRNGYMILYTVPVDGFEFYDQYLAGRLLYIKDLTYLPYIS